MGERRPAPCGTLTAYGRGCRCDACRAVKSAAFAAYRAERRGTCPGCGGPRSMRATLCSTCDVARRHAARLDQRR